MALFKSPIELESGRINALARKITGVNRPGLIMFYSHGCGHCLAMQSTWQQLHDEMGKEYAIHAIDCYASGANQQKCGQMGIQGYPTIFMFSKTGKLGGQPSSRDLATLKAALKGAANLSGGGSRRRSARRSPRKRSLRRKPRK